jgi:hypothetical protein
VVVLSGRRVKAVESPPDGAAHVEWIHRNFTPNGVAAVGRPGLAGEEPAAQARQAFGLPPSAPVRTG